jgi:hypothetical protein
LGSLEGLYWNHAGLVVKTFRLREHEVILYRVDVEARAIVTVIARYTVKRRANQRPGSDTVSCLYCETAIGPDGEIIVASPDTAYRIMQINSAGSVVRAWQRSELDPVAFTDAEREHFDALARRAGRPSSGDLFRGFKPRFQVRSLGVDGDGRLWARPTRTFGDPALFDVFGRDREFLGSVRLDRPVRMMFVRGHTLMAVAETREGEPQVFVYRIREVP